MKYKILTKLKIENKRYWSYNARLILNIMLFFGTFTLGILSLIKAFDFVEQETINYSEKSNLDYKVYLKENDFYEFEYLGKDMLYVANLIDKVKIDFDYNFYSDKNVNLDFTYNIVGNLVISDGNGKNTYFKKEYVLLKDKVLSIEDGKKVKIDETVSIDYDYYNALANRFKTAYGVETSSKLTVYLTINKKNSSLDETVILYNNSNNQMAINIPLSEKAVDIEMNYKKIDASSDLISKSNIVIDNIVYMLIALILIVFSIIFAIKIIRLLSVFGVSKSQYDKYLKKILNEYDRLIVETSTCPIINDDNVISIGKFSELLDVRDNLKAPVMYCPIAEHQKCYFYINSEDKIYLHTVKATDLENE